MKTNKILALVLATGIITSATTPVFASETKDLEKPKDNTSNLNLKTNDINEYIENEKETEENKEVEKEVEKTEENKKSEEIKEVDENKNENFVENLEKDSKEENKTEENEEKEVIEKEKIKHENKIEEKEIKENVNNEFSDFVENDYIVNNNEEFELKAEDLGEEFNKEMKDFSISVKDLPNYNNLKKPKVKSNFTKDEFEIEEYQRMFAKAYENRNDKDVIDIQPIINKAKENGIKFSSEEELVKFTEELYNNSKLYQNDTYDNESRGYNTRYKTSRRRFNPRNVVLELEPIDEMNERHAKNIVTKADPYVKVGMDKEKRDIANKEIKRIAESISKTKTDEQKAKEVADIIVNGSKYIEEASTDNIKNNNAYGALIEKESQCTGFATAYTAILRQMNIPAYTVTGLNRSGERHAWNVIYVNNQWLYVDITNSTSEGRKEIDDRYFLKTNKNSMFEKYQLDNRFSNIIIGLDKKEEKSKTKEVETIIKNNSENSEMEKLEFTPLIPLEPAEEFIPLTPLEPAKPIEKDIPLTPLEPAEEITPLIPLEPAETIEEDIPLTPLKPAEEIKENDEKSNKESKDKKENEKENNEESSKESKDKKENEKEDDYFDESKQIGRIEDVTEDDPKTGSKFRRLINNKKKESEENKNDKEKEDYDYGNNKRNGDQYLSKEYLEKEKLNKDIENKNKEEDVENKNKEIKKEEKDDKIDNVETKNNEVKEKETDKTKDFEEKEKELSRKTKNELEDLIIKDLNKIINKQEDKTIVINNNKNEKDLQNKEVKKSIEEETKTSENKEKEEVKKSNDQRIAKANKAANIFGISNSTKNTNPKTGVSGIANTIGIMSAAGAALTVSKKRKNNFL